MGLLKIRRSGESQAPKPDLSTDTFAPLPREILGISDAAAARIIDFKKTVGKPMLICASPSGAAAAQV